MSAGTESLAPVSEYAVVDSLVARSVVGSAIDIGAYEYGVLLVDGMPPDSDGGLGLGTSGTNGDGGGITSDGGAGMTAGHQRRAGRTGMSTAAPAQTAAPRPAPTTRAAARVRSRRGTPPRDVATLLGSLALCGLAWASSGALRQRKKR